MLLGSALYFRVSTFLSGGPHSFLRDMQRKTNTAWKLGLSSCYHIWKSFELSLPEKCCCHSISMDGWFSHVSVLPFTGSLLCGCWCGQRGRDRRGGRHPETVSAVIRDTLGDGSVGAGFRCRVGLNSIRCSMLIWKKWNTWFTVTNI